jgi:hypothetical protein
MPRVPILGGSYNQASLIAGAQRAVNLYPERNSEAAQAPVNVTHYPRPGLRLLSTPPAGGQGRGLYTATNGDLYAVINQALYYINPDFVWRQIGSLLTASTTPVYFADNGINALLVDGSAFGVNITLSSRTALAIADPNFLGGDRITFLNFFMLLNQPHSPNFYSTMAVSATFNALFFGSLTEWPGNCIAVIASEAALWVFGPYKGEVWADAGTSPFAFQVLSGVIIEHGLAGPYALGRQDVNVYWLSQSPEGARMAMRGAANAAQRISTHAIEHEWLTYAKVSDCIVQTYQIRGHAFILYHFPTVDRTWCFDEATQEWHEEAFYDVNGVQHRTRDTFMAYAYGKNVSLDWSNGNLYQRDETVFSDNGISCVYIRGMPHLIGEEFERITLWRVIADMECGNVGNTPNPLVTLQLSRDRGRSFVTHSVQTMGKTGQYVAKPTFNRCGQAAYDIVAQLSWAADVKTALNGVFAVIEPHELDV